MDQRERMADLEEVLRLTFESHQAELWTALPAIVQSYDPEEVTVSAQPTIQAYVRDKDGNWTWTNLGMLIHCPVVFPGGGGFLMTFPIQPGDEVLVIIASRCIDAWWQNGGIQTQSQLRMHDLSDGFALPRVFSKPNAPSSLSTQNAQLRTRDGSCLLEITPGGVIHLAAPGGMIVDGDVQVNGKLTATDEVAAKTSHTVSQHTHGGVQSGSDATEKPAG